MSAAESASRCDKCGEIVADIDAGFSPGMQAMGHECGGRWRRVMWDRASGAWEALRPGRKPIAEGAGKTARIEWRVLPATKAEWQAKADAAELGDDGMAEFEQATSEQATAPAYRELTTAHYRPQGPCLRIPAYDARAMIPQRFAPSYLLQA